MLLRCAGRGCAGATAARFSFDLDGGAARGLARPLSDEPDADQRIKRAVRLPDGDLPAMIGDGTSKSAASRRFVALSAKCMAEWMSSDLSQLDLLVIQIDGLHIGKT